MRRASIWVKFISKNSNTLEKSIVYLTLLLSFLAVDFISGQLISLTNPMHRITGQFVNKLLCDRALLTVSQYPVMHVST